VKRTYPVIAILALLAALAVAGCGGSSSSSSSSSEENGYGSKEGSTSTTGSSSKPASSGGAAATIGVTNVGGEAGTVLVDSKGFTLYYFKKDKGGKSACYGGCAAVWPPLTTEGAPKGMGGAQAAKLGTTKRNDGTTQVTYAGWPLYTYVTDKKPGEDNGTDVKSFGASWYPLHPNGEKAGE
jgi:predicted lipoprotein with Yx(FWY)xxD motif